MGLNLRFVVSGVRGWGCGNGRIDRIGRTGKVLQLLLTHGWALAEACCGFLKPAISGFHEIKYRLVSHRVAEVYAGCLPLPDIVPDESGFPCSPEPETL